MGTSNDNIDGFKAMLSGFEGMALEIFAQCHDPDKEKMLIKVRQAFDVLKQEVQPLSTETELDALFANLQERQ